MLMSHPEPVRLSLPFSGINKLFIIKGMILSFANKETAALFSGYFVKTLAPEIQGRACLPD